MLVLSGAADLCEALGPTAIQASSPRDALDRGLVDAEQIDVVVIDGQGLCLGEEGGVGPLKRAIAGIPTLLVGAAEEPALDDLAARVGAADTLERPLDLRVLPRRLGLLAEVGQRRRDHSRMQVRNVESLAEVARMRAMIDEEHQITSAILDGIHAAILTTDMAGRIAFINRAACAVLGMSPGALLGTGVEEALQLPPEGHEALAQPTGTVTRFSCPLRRPDGEVIEIGVSISRAEAASARLGHFVTFRDLSQVPAVEMDQRRVERLTVIGTMATGFAHEVRNPLASLRILGEALESEIERDDPRREYTSRMMQQLDRIERLVKTSLQFGRPEPARKSRHVPSAIALSAIDALAPRTQSGASVALSVAPDLPLVYVDDAQIVQVLVILLNNAIDAAGAPDKVELVVRQGEEGGAGAPVRFEVVDSGPGIPKHVLPHIFDPFFTTKRSGTGLGLSIAHQLVHENCGKMEVSSIIGQATHFSVIIPRVRA
ncbi:MAG: ATP-binding protein [Byssovorax sp.]